MCDFLLFQFYFIVKMKFDWQTADVLETLKKIKNSECSISDTNKYFEEIYSRTFGKSTLYRHLPEEKSLDTLVLQENVV